jgi:RimJ/RimL family protein N-acetyltransferase
MVEASEFKPGFTLATGPNVRIRVPLSADVALINRWMSDAEVWGWISTYPEPLLVESAEQLGDVVAVIEGHRIHGVIGYCLMRAEEPWNKTGMLDVVIGDSVNRGLALGIEAATLFMAILFRSHRLHRMEARVVDDNRKCLSAIRKYGFTEEGLLRDRFVKNGRFRGVHVFSLLAEEFEQLRVARRTLRNSKFAAKALTGKGE